MGQVLAAMLVGHALNQQSQTIYGCYVVGRNWYFVTLRDNADCLSQAFEATTDELFAIFRILKVLKQIISELTL